MKAARCELCPRRCYIRAGELGFCGARGYRSGRVQCLNYGRVTALALDAVEKKPFRRFAPGKTVLSAGSYGCNYRCPFCQNAAVSTARHGEIKTAKIGPEELVQRALSYRNEDCVGVAFTYNEPLVGYEYVLDGAYAAQKEGVMAAVVTNGSVCEAPMRRLLPFLDAINIDLKGFSQACYDAYAGDLATVRRNIELAAASCHLEVTTLIVPGLNDSEEMMEAEAAYLASIDPDLPLHITRFYPRYRMTGRLPTAMSSLLRLRAVAERHLNCVYLGA